MQSCCSSCQVRCRRIMRPGTGRLLQCQVLLALCSTAVPVESLTPSRPAGSGQWSFPRLILDERAYLEQVDPSSDSQMQQCAHRRAGRVSRV